MRRSHGFAEDRVLQTQQQGAEADQQAKVVVRIRNSLANTPKGGRPAIASTASANATASRG